MLHFDSLCTVCLSHVGQYFFFSSGLVVGLFALVVL